MSNQKTVVITGVSKGIGRATLENLAKCEECKTVIGIGRDLKELKSQFGDNPKVKLFEADVTDFSPLQSIAHQVGEPDLVVGNAGVMTPGKPVWEVTQDELDESYKVNIRGVFNTMKVFLPLMRHREGAVVANVSSDWGICASKGRSTYCMSKFGVEGLTKAGALDLEQDPVSLVTVAPGVVYSDMLVEAFGEEEARKQGTPVEQFALHFVKSLWTINKSHSGQHLDFAYKRERATGR